MEHKAIVWCVEDDKRIREMELFTLDTASYKVCGFSDGESFLEELALVRRTDGMPDLILLDIMLPGMDGVEILERLKRDADTSDIPVIMTTAKNQEYDKVQTLDLGADDYLVKPFGMMEMISHIKAVLRRCRPRESSSVLVFGGIELDRQKHLVTVDGERIDLTYKEYELLRLFMGNPGVAFTRENLFASVWGDAYAGESRTIDMHIRTLRQKLGPAGDMIVTIRNVGYRMEVH